ncbi:MAG TPA: hypothetical protein VMG30_17935 [Acidobacteriota bacterium]|nr:hypothetical protein [Acidobacteriota bacterium]
MSKNLKRQIARQIAQALAIIFPLIVMAVTASAQRVVSTKAGIIQHVEGNVFLDSVKLQLLPDKYIQMQPGQSLRTEYGLVEVLLSPEVYLWIGTYSLLRLEQNQLDDTRLTLENGSALIEIVREIKGTRTRIRLVDGEVEIAKGGLYRFEAGSGEVRVYGSSALVSKANKTATIKSGRSVFLGTGLAVKKFDKKEADSLHQWAGTRSFALFFAAECPSTQPHWYPRTFPWMYNPNFRMRISSQECREEWYRNGRVSVPTTNQTVEKGGNIATQPIPPPTPQPRATDK